MALFRQTLDALRHSGLKIESGLRSGYLERRSTRKFSGTRTTSLSQHATPPRPPAAAAAAHRLRGGSACFAFLRYWHHCRVVRFSPADYHSAIARAHEIHDYSPGGTD